MTNTRARRAVVLACLLLVGCAEDDSSAETSPSVTQPAPVDSEAVATTPAQTTPATSQPETSAASTEPTLAAIVEDGLVIAPAVAVGDFSNAPHIAALGEGFIRVWQQAGEVDVSVSDDGLIWSSIDSDLDVFGIQSIASGGDRVVAIAYDESGEDITPWLSNDGGSSWTSLPLPAIDAYASEFVREALYAESIAVTADRIVLAARQNVRVDWRAYSIEVLQQDHGSVDGERGDPSSWTVSFEDGFQLTVDLEALGLPNSFVAPQFPTIIVHGGEEWTQHPQEQWSPGGGLGGMQIVNGPAGFATVVQASLGYQVMSSTDGASWVASPVPPGIGPTGASIVGGPHGYVLVGDEALLHSPDGTTWIEALSFEDLDPEGVMSAQAHRPSGGPGGFVIPVFDGMDDALAGRLFWSTDGLTWRERQLPDAGFGVVTAVSGVGALVIPLVQARPADSVPSLPLDEGELVQVLAAAFYDVEPYTSGDGPPQWQSWVTESEAMCIGEGLIQDLGADWIRDLGIGAYHWSLIGYSLLFDLTPNEAQAMVDVFRSCSPDWELLMITTATQGTDIMSAESAACVQRDLDDDLAEEIFVLELARPLSGESGGGEPDLTHRNELIAAMEGCLTDRELNTIDWN